MTERRKVYADDLVGSKEIAGLLGLANPEQVHQLRQKSPGFPEPLTKLSVGFIWSKVDILKWQKAREARRLRYGGGK